MSSKHVYKSIRFKTWHVLFEVYAPVSDMYITFTVSDVLGNYCVFLLNGTIANQVTGNSTSL
jgi:hypothetical protein